MAQPGSSMSNTLIRMARQQGGTRWCFLPCQREVIDQELWARERGRGIVKAAALEGRSRRDICLLDPYLGCSDKIPWLVGDPVDSYFPAASLPQVHPTVPRSLRSGHAPARVHRGRLPAF